MVGSMNNGGPLEGVTVLDFSQIEMGPCATQVLGDFGRSAGGVVRDKQDAGADDGQGFDGAWSWLMAAEYGAVEIEQ